MKLAKRTYLHPPEMRRDMPASKAWFAPQREHPKTPMPKRRAA